MNTITMHQAGGGVISLFHLVDEQPIEGIVAGKYQIFDRDNAPVLTLQLGSGISVVDGHINITISSVDCLLLAGPYTHECSVRDVYGRDLFVLTGHIKFIATHVRI